MTTSILIVEDEKIIAKGIEKQLQALGYDVVGLCIRGEEAIQKAAELRPDLVLMDINLGGGMDGVSAADAIRKQCDIPVVYLTAFSDSGTFQRAKLTEPYGYVLKPYEDRDLHIAIEIGLYRHRTDRRLRENEQWLSATLASIGDGVIATDQQGKIRLMNALAEQLTGWTQADASGREISEVFHIIEESSRDRIPNPALEAQALAEPVLLPANTLLIDKDGGERPIDDSAAPIRAVDGQVAGAVLVFRDITERRRLEEHLRQAQKMEAIGRLAGGIAHDFNNILTVITGFSELLLTGVQTAEERKDFLEKIHDAGKRAAALTQQILSFSRKQMLVPTVMNLNTVLRDMESLVKRLIGSHIEFTVEFARDLGAIKADPTQIGQIMLNLAANARDAIGDGGRLTASTANASVSAEEARTSPILAPGRYTLLTVSDTGCGISEGVLDRIFEPFFTTKVAGQGTGLGLATVYGIVQQSGGHIDVTSKPGQGTTFRVYFPQVAESPPAPVLTPPSIPGTETILLVDDEPSVRRMTKLVLERHGYSVLEAGNGPEALSIANTHPGPIHILITDLIMPNMPGRILAERVRASKPGTRVLFMSGYSEDAVVLHGVQVGKEDFVGKPFTIGGLTRKIREILDRPS